MKIKAIETKYKGYKFRSRLEARWAVFFDAMGYDWEYEVEGYQLSNGQYYLPDFKLTLSNGRDIYYEIKPRHKYSDIKFEQFIKDMNEDTRDKNKIDQECERPIDPIGYILSGDPIDVLKLNNSDGRADILRDFMSKPSFNIPVEHFAMFHSWPMVCPSCGSLKAELIHGGTLVENAYYSCNCCHKSDTYKNGKYSTCARLWNSGEKSIDLEDVETGHYLVKTEKAARLARQARFEHGETPNEFENI